MILLNFNIRQINHFIFLIMLFPTLIFASSQKDTFRRYPNRVFVETGSFMGDGIQCAIDAGFLKIHSIELSPKYYTICQTRFKKYPQVHIWLGDSAKIIKSIIQDIKEPITFWLDGHCSLGDTAIGDTMSPILMELEQIKQHPIKTHTILIDDVRLFGTWHFDWTTLDEIVAKIYEINPDYTITFENGSIENDILVAYIQN